MNTQKDNATLPGDCWCNVLSFLPLPNILHNRLVSKTLNFFCQSNVIWKPLFEALFINRGLFSSSLMKDFDERNLPLFNQSTTSKNNEWFHYFKYITCLIPHVYIDLDKSLDNYFEKLPFYSSLAGKQSLEPYIFIQKDNILNYDSRAFTLKCKPSNVTETHHKLAVLLSILFRKDSKYKIKKKFSPTYSIPLFNFVLEIGYSPNPKDILLSQFCFSIIHDNYEFKVPLPNDDIDSKYMGNDNDINEDDSNNNNNNNDNNSSDDEYSNFNPNAYLIREPPDPNGFSDYFYPPADWHSKISQIYPGLSPKIDCSENDDNKSNFRPFLFYDQIRISNKTKPESSNGSQLQHILGDPQHVHQVYNFHTDERGWAPGFFNASFSWFDDLEIFSFHNQKSNKLFIVMVHGAMRVW